MHLSRRELLRTSALTGAAIAAGSAFSGLALGGVSSAGTGGYGSLRPDPAGLLDLPTGFRYEILGCGGSGHAAAAATTYDDGQKLAGDADGSASFAIGGNRTVLVTNHELSPSESFEAVPQTFGGDAVPTYDPGCAGGTSNYVLDRTNRVRSLYPSLAGTYNNCGGGPTPWGTWLTCEENSSFVTKQHGYVFEVDPEGKLTTAVPYTQMGRCNHEAVAIDPETSYAYLTEDSSNGLLYRFVPDDTSGTYGSLGNGGRLSAMKAGALLRLGEVTAVGTTVPVTWTPIAAPDVPGLNATLADVLVTRSTKLEGMWFGNGLVYFGSSYENRPGLEHHGQIWALDPAEDTITLVAHIPVDHPVFDSPDNITVTPWGQLLLCEDGDDEQYLVGLEPSDGSLWAFARNADPAMNEFTGANFSPDGKTLYVNIQDPSTTFAVTGPWGAVRNGQH